MIELITEIDRNLNIFIDKYGIWVYGLMFLSVFLKMGVVFLPFLPGDTLLVVVGVMISQGTLGFPTCFILLASAAILGGMFNYATGKYSGKKVLNMTIRKRRIISPKLITRTEKFLEKHGAKALLIARFVPVLRPITPFVAGMGQMHYPQFLLYNVIGGCLWVVTWIAVGFFFGNVFN